MSPKRLHEVLLRDVGVTLGCGDRGVAEDLLDHPDVRAMPQQQRGNGVADHVGRHMSGNAGLVGETVEDSRDTLGGQGPAGRVEQERILADL